MGYHPSLDGLRGIAVLLVVLFHYGLLLPGWVGVQLFFVLSGFLITCGLVETQNLPASIYFGRFYWRRTLRIFPLNYAVLLVSAVVFIAIGVPRGFEQSLPFLATYTTNFLRMTQQDVCDWFVHFWSLAVEEQFYLVWPLGVFFLTRASFRRLVVAIIVLGPCLRAVLALLLHPYVDDAERIAKLVYLNPLSHFDAFATGAVLVLYPRWKEAGTWRNLVGVLALLATAGAAQVIVQHLQGGVAWQACGYQMYLAANYQFVWGYTLINFACGMAVACCLNPHVAKRFLNWGPLRYIGRVSYGIYVFHFPLLRIMDANWERPSSGALAVLHFVAYLVLTFAISAISFEQFERRFLKLKDRYFSVRALSASTGP